MSIFFSFLLLLSIIAFIVGMVKPKLIMRWAPEEKQNRKWVAIVTIIGMIVFMVLSSVTMTPEEKAAIQARQEQRQQEREAKAKLEAEKKAAEEKAAAEKKAAEEQADAEKKANEEKKVSEEKAVAETPEVKIKSKVREYVRDNYKKTTIDSITVNPDLGTATDGDYVVLVHLTWDEKNTAKTTKEVLDMYSSDMAARMHKDLPEVQELAVFWTVPYLNNGSAKISFERKTKGMVYTDTMFDSNFR